MATAGIIAGAALGYALARVAASYILDLKMPSALPVVLSALLILTCRWLPCDTDNHGAPQNLRRN